MGTFSIVQYFESRYWQVIWIIKFTSEKAWKLFFLNRLNAFHRSILFVVKIQKSSIPGHTGILIKFLIRKWKKLKFQWEMSNLVTTLYRTRSVISNDSLLVLEKRAGGGMTYGKIARANAGRKVLGGSGYMLPAWFCRWTSLFLFFLERYLKFDFFYYDL